MDIDLLSKMVKELILDNDEVYLPGIGSFVAELVPSTFSDKGYTINPPYRRLYFRQRQDGTDTALIDFYIRSNNLEREAGLRIITDFLEELKVVLEQKKNIVFPGLGRLRATRENNFFFVADEDLDIYPEGFGLEPVSLKTHQETKEEVSAALDGLKFIMKETVDQAAGENVIKTTEGDSNKTAEEITGDEAQEDAIEIFEDVSVEAGEEIIMETAGKSDAETGKKLEEEAATEAAEEASTEKHGYIHPVLAIIIFIGILAIIALIALIVLGHITPEFIDKFLYGSEELEILYK